MDLKQEKRETALCKCPKMSRPQRQSQKQRQTGAGAVGLLPQTQLRGCRRRPNREGLGRPWLRDQPGVVISSNKNAVPA